MSMKFLLVFLLSSSLVLGGTPSPAGNDCEGMKIQIRQLRNFQLALSDGSGDLQKYQDEYNKAVAEILFINGLLDMQQQIAEFKQGVAQAQEVLGQSAQKLEDDNKALQAELDKINEIVKQGEKIHTISDDLNTLFDDKNLDIVISSMENGTFDSTDREPRINTIYEKLVEQIEDGHCGEQPDVNDNGAETLCGRFRNDIGDYNEGWDFKTSETVEDVLKLVIAASLNDGKNPVTKKKAGTLDKARFKSNLSKFKKLVPTNIQDFGSDINKKYLMQLKGLTEANHTKVLQSGHDILLKYNDFLGKTFDNMKFAHADEIKDVRDAITGQIKINTGKIVEYRNGQTIVPDSPKFNYKDLFKENSLLDLHFRKNNTTYMDLESYINRGTDKAVKYEGYIKGLVESAGCEYKQDVAIVTQCLLELENSKLGARRADLASKLAGLKDKIDGIQSKKEYQAVDYMINLLANRLLEDCTDAPGSGKVTHRDYNNPNSCTNLIFREDELGKIPLMADDVELIMLKLSATDDEAKDCQIVRDKLQIDLPIVREQCRAVETVEQCTNDKLVENDDGSCSETCKDENMEFMGGDCVPKAPETPEVLECENDKIEKNEDGSCSETCKDESMEFKGGDCVPKTPEDSEGPVLTETPQDPVKCEKDHVKTKPDGSCDVGCISDDYIWIPAEGACAEKPPVDQPITPCDKPNVKKNADGSCSEECETTDYKYNPATKSCDRDEAEVTLCPDGKTQMLPGVECPIVEDGDGERGCTNPELLPTADGNCTTICKDETKIWDSRTGACRKPSSPGDDFGNPPPIQQAPVKCTKPHVAKKADGSCDNYCEDINKYKYVSATKECVRRDKDGDGDGDEDGDEDEDKYGGRKYYRSYDTDKYWRELRRDPNTGLDYVVQGRRDSTTSMFFDGLGRTFYPRSSQGLDMGASWSDFYGMYSSNNYMMDYNANLGYWGKQLQAYPPPQYGYPYYPPSSGTSGGPFYWGYNQGAFYQQNYYNPNIPNIGVQPVSF